MPKRTDIESILIIGSGPIVIGQACEFDYSGTQACKVLREEGYRVILVNSNPATIMTDPQFADRTYIEPITRDIVIKIIEKERPSAILPTMGGQTGLNVAIQVADTGILEALGVKMIGADTNAIRKAEDRDLFKKAMLKIGMDLPVSIWARTVPEALTAVERIPFPVIVRPSFTLGGTGGGIAFNVQELEQIARYGLEQSPSREVLIEEYLRGWKEYELEVMRDIKDNVVIVCSIENLDPMGIHTGDSITVAPAQTLTDVEYQKMRNDSIAIIREIGVETGGSNIQFAVDPTNGRQVVIEMNPRVSRSSALASKATGFPIAKMAARLAVGYTLDEITNDITRSTPACFEPTIDYCVVKIPRFAFEKFPQAQPLLSSAMKSIGETMAIGRTFKEAFNKGLRSLETGLRGYEGAPGPQDEATMRQKLAQPLADRIFHIKNALASGMTVRSIHELTGIDPWFIHNLLDLVEFEDVITEHAADLDPTTLRRAKEMGFSDPYIGLLTGRTELQVRALRAAAGILPVYKLVDTCAAEFEAKTPYYYSTYETEDEANPSDRQKVLIIGGGPNRIGQGIEFDYCCVHAAFAVREMGFEALMVNSNPETVSTDYDTSDKLFFEPLTLEDVLNIYEREKPIGTIVQLGGQTPLNLAESLEKAGVKILGTPVTAIRDAEDREFFRALVKKLNLLQPPNKTVTTLEEALKATAEIGYPVIIRPSYVLGGRRMEIVFDDDQVAAWFKDLKTDRTIEHPTILVDKFLEDAIEVDVDAVADGTTVTIGGILEHVEEAGVHSGDAACVMPPHTLSTAILDRLRRQTTALALELGVIGLMNVQFAIKADTIYLLEVNPRASRTVPFISKAIGLSLPGIATKVMLGKTLKELNFTREIEINFSAVKESAFPFARFPGVDAVVGPEMKSTGEVMGIDAEFGMALAKSQAGVNAPIPTSGTVFLSVKDEDKRTIILVAHMLHTMGFKLIATRGTARVIARNGIPITEIRRISEGKPNVLDFIINRDVHLIINTPSGKSPRQDEIRIRSSAVAAGIPLLTTAAEAGALVVGIDALKRRGMEVKALQDYHKELPGR
ncbi:MAG: carbamoyl-phosphate synthase large subunit [Planctomycetota bacterium]